MNEMTKIDDLEVGYNVPAKIGMAYERHPNALPDPRPRRARAEHQEDGRLRQGSTGMRHRGARQDAQVGRHAKAPDGARRRHRRLLPEGQRGRGLRPRRHQGHSRVERGPRPGQDRPPGAAAEVRRPSDRLRRRHRQRRRPVRRRPEARHHDRMLRRDRLRRRPLRRHDDARRWSRSPRRSTAAPGLKFTGIQAYQGAMQHMDELRRSARPSSTPRSPR